MQFGTKIRVVNRDYEGRWEIVPITTFPDGLISVAQPQGGAWIVKEFKYNEGINRDKVDPLTFPDEWIRMLYDELHKIFGKKESPEFESEIKAVRYHLEDMRRLVFENKS